jgi:hypothetical protein
VKQAARAADRTGRIKVKTPPWRRDRSKRSRRQRQCSPDGLPSAAVPEPGRVRTRWRLPRCPCCRRRRARTAPRCPRR